MYRCFRNKNQNNRLETSKCTTFFNSTIKQRKEKSVDGVKNIYYNLFFLQILSRKKNKSCC